MLPKGVHRVPRRLADGSVRVHYYAWRAGPAIDADPSDPVAFIAAYQRVIEAARAAPAEGTLVAALVLRYCQSPEFLRLSPHWRQQRQRWLNEIVEEWGEDDIEIFEDRRTRKDVIEWRNKFAANPRKADIAVAALNAFVNWAKDRGEIAVNVANGVGKLYSATRGDIIIEEEEFARALKEAAAIDARLPDAMRLIADTGLSRSDFVKLAWSMVGANSIAARRGKTKVLCAIPILSGARQALKNLPRVGPIIATDSNGRPWTPHKLTKAIAKAFERAGIVGKHLHDFRGTFATRMKLADFKVAEIADALGWSGADGEQRVSRIIDRYVDRDRIARERIARMERSTSKREG